MCAEIDQFECRCVQVVVIVELDLCHLDVLGRLRLSTIPREYEFLVQCHKPHKPILLIALRVKVAGYDRLVDHRGIL